ncbi:cystathionine beta-lyase [Bradyrhizobium sp. DOA1]|uniref:cystathionine beta-lyase n=1 Tax=Bradyrhizobium sp. DOA1 TaxID=1126616 RepID=UPI0009ED16E5|nr:cystathionine beta-lyase [Bradyrhizobium sp. DOA1]
MKYLQDEKDVRDTETLLCRLGRAPAEHAGMVNVPIYRGSTIISETLEEWDIRNKDNPSYGRFGTPLSRALETAICKLEGGYRSILFPSGQSACSHSLLACLKAGDSVLISDGVYAPVRAFADNVLARLQIKAEYFCPTKPSELAAKISAKTRAVYLESPSSMTFEVQDVPALAAIAHLSDALVIMDNTWATPLYFRPFEHGVDISVQAATKYIVGHSDAFLGVATANEAAWHALKSTAQHFGEIGAPDDIYLALRGIRTLGLRMRRHWENGLVLAQNLQTHPAVDRVLHPALPNDPGHVIWKRDFLGAGGLFGVVLKPMSPPQLSVLFNSLRLFGIGLSWGGYESLALLVEPPKRMEGALPFPGPLLRIHAGMESPTELIADLHSALNAACEVADDTIVPPETSELVSQCQIVS